MSSGLAPHRLKHPPLSESCSWRFQVAEAEFGFVPASLGQLCPFVEVLRIMYVPQDMCFLCQAEVAVPVSYLIGGCFVYYRPYQIRVFVEILIPEVVREGCGGLVLLVVE